MLDGVPRTQTSRGAYYSLTTVDGTVAARLYKTYRQYANLKPVNSGVGRGTCHRI